MDENQDNLEALSALFKVLGDPTRLRILSSLRRGELCVHELSNGLSLGQTVVSHHLRHLKTARLVRSRRQGKHIYYRLEDSHIEIILETGFEHIGER